MIRFFGLGSGYSLQALDQALAMFDGAGIDVQLLHVIEPPPNFYGMVLSDYFDEASGWASGYLEQVADELKSQGLQVAWEVRQGRVGQEIINAAVDHSVSLIAVATHGRTGLRRLMFGSNAERVLHHAATPLLLLPSLAEGEAEAAARGNASAETTK